MKKTILITGSTDGIGKLVAIKLAKEGHTVWLHGRNDNKLNSVISEIKIASNNSSIQGIVADFSDLGAVKRMGKQIKKALPNIDVLINNAGVYKSPESNTVDGFDIRFAVNYFAPFVLTNQILPLLKKGHAPRIINLSSAAQAPVSMEALVGNEQISTMAAYAQSKFALTLWSFYLAEMEPELNVIAVNPGSLLNTKMVIEGWGYHKSSADKGSDILYDLAMSEKYKNDSGKYFDNDIGAFGLVQSSEISEKAINALIEKTNDLLM